MRTVYKIWQGKASLKVQVGRLSLNVTMIIEQRLNKKNIMTVNALRRKSDDTYEEADLLYATV